MLEWQAESSLFTVRVRGKQWYWVYKFELKSITDILSAPKNIGHNKWFISFFNDLKTADDYLHIIQLRSQTNWIKFYWNSIFERQLKDSNLYITSPRELLLLDYNLSKKLAASKLPVSNEIKNFFLKHKKNSNYLWASPKLPATNNLNITQANQAYLTAGYGFQKLTPSVTNSYSPVSGVTIQNMENVEKFFNLPAITTSKNLLNNKLVVGFKNSEFSDINRWLKLSDELKFPVRIIKTPLKYINFNDETNTVNPNFKLFRLKFNDNDELFQHKPLPQSSYLIYKQKRYQRRDKISPKNNFVQCQTKSSIFSKYAETTPDFTRDNILKVTELPEFGKTSETSQTIEHTAESYNSLLKLLTAYSYLNKSQHIELNKIGNSFTQYILSSWKLFEENKKLNNLPESFTITDADYAHLNNYYNIKFPMFYDFQNNFNSAKLNSKVLENINSKTPTSSPKSLLAKYYEFTLKNNIFNTDAKKICKNFFNPYLFGNQLIVDNLEAAMPNYRSLKKNKNIAESASVSLNRRLLRTKRTLVLPAHVNITIITNSYDVIHSWFIPGLGLKLDCIPGRATHHTIHIENVGFYYGQCAEICGRYHHHMPIRICALPFEHFLVWWNTFGLPKMLNTNSKTKLNNLYSTKKYSW